MLNSMVSHNPEILKFFFNNLIIQSIPVKYAGNILTSILQILAKI